MRYSLSVDWNPTSIAGIEFADYVYHGNRIIYNYPAVAAGIDLNSDDVVDIAMMAPNICGIMLSYVLHLLLHPLKQSLMF